MSAERITAIGDARHGCRHSRLFACGAALGPSATPIPTKPARFRCLRAFGCGGQVRDLAASKWERAFLLRPSCGVSLHPVVTVPQTWYPLWKGSARTILFPHACANDQIFEIFPDARIATAPRRINASTGSKTCHALNIRPEYTSMNGPSGIRPC